MPMIRDIQAAFTTGEYDPRLAERVDVTFTQSAARIMENVIALPQGGFVNRPGMPVLMRKRHALSAVSTAGATVTAPQGGTAGNAVDGDETTTLDTTGALGTVDPYVIAHLDFISVIEPSAVDLIDVGVSDESDATIAVQASTDDATWSTVATMTLGGTVRSRRLAGAPAATLGAYRYWRVARLGGTDLGSATISLAELLFWSEGSTIGAGKVFDFTVDETTEYQFILTAGHVDMVRTKPLPRARVASARAPYAEADISAVKASQSRDLMLMFHRDHPTLRLFRQGGDAEWDFRDQVFDSVTQFPWGDAFVSGGVNEIQRLEFTSATAGDTWRLELSGEYTADITHGASLAATATAVESALEALDQITSVSVGTVTGGITVEFDGTDGKRAWPILVPVVVASTSGITIDIDRTQGGKPDTAPLWDADHGYPADGVFYQGRLWMGGFRDRLGAVVGSRAGSFFDLEEDNDPSTGSPLFFEADTDEQVAVQAIHAGRHLQIFTSAGEFYVPSEPITAENIAIKQTSRIGTSRGVPTVDVEGATLFISRSGGALMEYLFVDTEQSYQASEVSLLAGHLVRDPLDVAMRRRLDVDQPALYMIANGGDSDDGSRAPSALVTILRAQQVTAFTRWTSPNATIEGVGATQFGDVLALVNRTIGATEKDFIEYFDPECQLDGGALVENPDVDISSASGVGPYSYTFTAATAADVVVYSRPTTDGVWGLVAAADYTLSLGAKTVTLATAQSGGQVRISKPMTTVTLTSDTTHLDGVALRVVVDGFDQGDAMPSSEVITLPVAADFSVEYGFHYTAQVVALPYRPATKAGQPLAVKSRIPNVSLSLYRTGSVYVGQYGGTLRNVALGLPATGVREARLASGNYRKWGIPGWRLDGALHIRRDKAEPLMVRAAVYDLRW